jgi:phosphatidate cytidylyltransferase
MGKVAQRLLIFFIGVPAVIGIVLFLPYYKHLVLNIFTVIFSAIGAVEFAAMLEKKLLYITKAQAFIFGLLAPLSLALTINFNFPEWIIPLMVMSGALWAVISRAFSSLEKMESVTNHLAASLSVLVYPGFFMFWLVKMTAWDNAGAIILIFLFIAFGSDSAAWLSGTLFGKNNRGIIQASPNKSIAGFIGGIIGSIIISGGAALLFPKVFNITGDITLDSGLLAMAVLLGICTGIASALGDLAESAIKRSCGVKDSGKLMLGRGGVLDSIDSIAFAAPIYFMLFRVFFFD